MQLSHIEISNYRNLSGVNIDFSDDINIIVGENNIGKSNLLYCILSILTGKKFEEMDFFDKEKPIIIDFSLHLDDEELGVFDDFFDAQDHHSINIVATQSTPDDYITYTHKETQTSISRADIVNNLNFINYDSLRNPKTEINFTKTKGAGLFLNYIIAKYLSKTDSTLYLVEEKIQKLNEYIREILAKLTCFNKFDIVTNASDDPSTILPKIFELYDNNDIPLERSGYGIQFNILILLSILEKLVKFSKNNESMENRTFHCIISFDEPEIHLSPFLQRSILNNIKNIAQGKDNDFNSLIKELFNIDTFTAQLLVSTHSKEIIENDYHKIIRLYNNASNVNTISGKNLNIETEEKHWYKEFSYIKEAMFARKVIIFEGDSEQGALNSFSKKLNINLDDHNISLIKASGANNILPLANLFDAFQITPILIYDKDKYDEYQQKQKSKEKLDKFGDNVFKTDSKCFDSEMVFSLYTDQGITVLEKIRKEFNQDSIQKTSINQINKQYNLKILEQDYNFASSKYPDETLKYMYISYFQQHKTVLFGQVVGEECPVECIPECYKSAIKKAIE